MRVPAGARACSSHLAGIHGGEEVLADQPDQAQRSDRKTPERGEHRRAMPQRPIEQADVAVAQPLEQRG